MKKVIATMLAVGALSAPLPVSADPDYIPYTLDAMGCMRLGECTDDIFQLTDVDQMEKHFPGVSYDSVREEANEILMQLEESGVQVYLGHGQYFPLTHRGSYYTDSNKFFLNESHMHDPEVFIKVLRHEGWHAAQDCMAGGLDNSMIAVIYTDDQVPTRYKLDAEVRYGMLQPRAIPWEQEAIWAGNTPDMTLNALEACASPTPMWEIMPPTPMTQEWLRSEGLL